MKYVIVIPSTLERNLRKHLFQNQLEQGAFLFAQIEQVEQRVLFNVVDAYLVSEDGWLVQTEVHLEMKDSERSKIMALARKGNYAAIDCHSHPHSNGKVAFSPSDEYGITEFAALVWGEISLDGVVWSGDFQSAQRLDLVQFTGRAISTVKPQGSWFTNKAHLWGKRGVNGK